MTCTTTLPSVKSTSTAHPAPRAGATSRNGPPPRTPAPALVDLALDDLGRPIRLELHAGDWQVRAAALNGVTWVRTDPSHAHATEDNAPAHGFTGTSPAFLIATARLLRLAPASPATRVRLVAFTDPVLAPRTLDQSWALLKREAHPTDNGPLTVDEYQVTALDTGEQHAVHLAGDVVLAAPGIELEHLETPPSTFA
ncbi:Glycolipid-binding domain-containing protein OS=Streptomyces alboniger OX=132473 GN=CP975_13770 PE=4 SV=1 [Streptomyces alboniger]